MLISQPKTAPGRFRWLRRVHEAFEAMLAAIDEAQTSVRLEMYIYTDSTIGVRFRDALVRAAERGVLVRVLVDGVGSLTLPDSFWGSLIRAGGAFRSFNPLQLNRVTIRNHRKLLVCDERVAFIGGFNIAEEYDGDGLSRGWYDLGLQLSGVLVQELTASFDLMFSLADFQHRRFVRLRRAHFSSTIATADGRLLFAGPGRGRHHLTKSLLRDLRRAKRVRIISAYFLPTLAIRRALNRVARRGGQVQLMLAGKSDVALSQLASRHFYGPLLKSGVEIYEYQPQILHAKLFVIDDVVYAGSANLDRRSLFINYELLVRLAQGQIAEEAAKIFADALPHCARVDPHTWRRSRGFWAKFKERWAFWLLARVDPYVARRQMRWLQSLR